MLWQSIPDVVIPTNVQRTSELRPLFYDNTVQNRSTCSAGQDYYVQYILGCLLLEQMIPSTIHSLVSLSFLLFSSVAATPLLWDGRAPFNLTNSDLNASIGPYLTYVTSQTIIFLR